MRGLVVLLAACGLPGKDDDRPADPTFDPPDPPDTTPVLPDADDDGSPDAEDCDDADPAVFPGAPDACDDQVSDCLRTSDDGLVTIVGGATYDGLAAALAAASPDDELQVCGRHRGEFVADVPVHLVGLGGAERAAVDGDGTHRALALPGGSSIAGLRVTGGWTDDAGGGVQQTSAGTLSVVDCVITLNRAGLGGGIALSAGGTATISGTTLEINLAMADGGSLYVPAGATADLTGSTVSRSAAVRGGGVEIAGGTLIGGLVYENLATFDAHGDGGGGLAIHGGGAVVGTEVTANGAVNGGGVAVAGGGTATLTDVRIHANACGPSEVVNGIGLSVQHADAVLEGTTEVVDHACGGYGHYSSGAVQVYDGSMTGGTVARNEARFGGGLNLSDATVTDVIVEENRGAFGGGILAMGPAEIVGGRVAFNDAGGEGGGVSGFSYLGYFAFTVTLRDVEVVDNTSYTGGGLSGYGADFVVEGGAILRNTASYTGGGAVLLGSDLTSIEVDWGEGADDNVPSDVWIDQTDYGYGADASFVCSEDSCQ